MKKKKVHSLTGRITLDVLRKAFQAVKRNRGAAGVDKVSIGMFAANLEENLKEYGYNLDDIPYVIQYNKRDLPNIAPVEYLEYMLNRRSRRVPYFESVAVEGKGVFDTLNTVSRMVLVREFGQAQEARS